MPFFHCMAPTLLVAPLISFPHGFPKSSTLSLADCYGEMAGKFIHAHTLTI